MKKYLLYFSSALLVAALLIWAGVHVQETDFYGSVVSVQPDEELGISAVTLRLEHGKTKSFYLGKETWSFALGAGSYWRERDVRINELIPGAKVDFYCRGSHHTKSMIDGEMQSLRNVDHIRIRSLPTDDTVALSDGTVLRLWNAGFGDITYCLEDGTELLTESWHGLTGDVDLLLTLSPDIPETLSAYYDDLGKLYDIQTYLEQTWAEYQDCQAHGRSYLYHRIDQNTNLLRESERCLYCTTELTVPIVENRVECISILHAFDKTTGEEIPVPSLFTCSEEVLLRELRSRCDQFEPERREELLRLMRIDDLTLEDTELCAAILPSRLTNSEGAYILSWPYDTIADLIQPWAIPLADHEE